MIVVVFFFSFSKLKSSVFIHLVPDSFLKDQGAPDDREFKHHLQEIMSVHHPIKSCWFVLCC